MTVRVQAWKDIILAEVAGASITSTKIPFGTHHRHAYLSLLQNGNNRFDGKSASSRPQISMPLSHRPLQICALSRRLSQNTSAVGQQVTVGAGGLYGFLPAFRIDLSHDASKVILDGKFGKIQFAGNLFVGQAARN